MNHGTVNSSFTPPSDLLNKALISTGVGIWYWNVRTRQICFDPSWLDMLNLKEFQVAVTLEEWGKRIHPDDRFLVMKSLNDFKSLRSPVYFSEHRILTGDGQYLWVRDSGSAIESDEEGRPLIAIGTLVNINQLKQTEEQQRALQLQYQSLVENQTDNIVRYHPETAVITFANKSFFTQFGFKAGDSIENFVQTKVHPDDKNRLLEIRPELSNNQSPSHIEIRIDTHHGYQWFLLEGYRIENAGDLAPEVQVVGRNINDRIRTIEELMQARQIAEELGKAKTQFISKVSHELRTPLNSILGYSTLLEKIEMDPKSIGFVKAIYSNSRHLKLLIDDLLDFSKIESNRMQVNMRAFNLYTTLDEVVIGIGSNLQEGVEMKVDIGDDLPVWIEFDQLKLIQILNNLLSNALKYTSNGFVALRVSLLKSSYDAADIIFTVKDSGVGIPSDKFGMIFKPFEQVQQDDYLTQKGTGLGLSIVKANVDLLQGEITLKSELGVGTEFTVIFRNIKKFVRHHNDDDLSYGHQDEVLDGFSQLTKSSFSPIMARVHELSSDSNDRSSIERVFDDILADLSEKPLLRKDLVNSYHNEFNEAQLNRRIASIRLFNDKLQIISRDYSSDSLQKLSTMISDYLGVFNIDQLEKALKIFAARIGQLASQNET